MLEFNKPCHIGKEETAIQEAITNQKLAGNGPFGKKCTDWLEDYLNCSKAILTPSCTAALEMTALLTETGPGDEIIMPSYTFVSTANAFALRGAYIRFVDVEPETMNISPAAVEAAITDNTKAIVVVHYAGIGCDMEAIMEIAKKNDLWVIEDAAQALTSTYNGRQLGTIGHFSTFSFHETKNITCGEGGALVINHPEAVERAEILQEKGTNRKQFVKGMVDKYSWRDIGSSYLLSEVNAAYLWVQLEHAGQIMANRLETWEKYYNGLRELGPDSLPHVPENCTHNAHMFYIKTDRRSELMDYLQDHSIMAVTHYVPLHTSHAGRKFGQFAGSDIYTTAESEKILRLPLFYGIEEKDVDHVINHIKHFFKL
ncbi:dTDP-4-amino-4,6-dideoxygalactose transaminase [Lentibacillus sp. CBA3610]|uniref:dTDP-4-amino-4,6-dideoxygalactose transaminase n=1 Tax=Lentibacillus sp. CBA3610 TaxID=2518176 RepID=UPI0015958C92|nr:dTDP-4-amino-4,6-dideoxygalactose transaminase [Lentibacillus sp. CBA3610]QKY70021.1 dTDP-4-amino-4,6-dideoxygalactose transaminase [Lentibacillus sp. CBA3610]